MADFTERVLEIRHALADRRCGINVKRSSVTLHEAFQWNFVTLQRGPNRTAAKKSLSHFAIGKGRRTALAPVYGAIHLRLGSPLTLVTLVIVNEYAVIYKICP